MRAFKHRIPRKMYDSKMEEYRAGRNKKTHNKELYNWCSSPDIAQIISAVDVRSQYQNICCFI